jgi:hypothetical protein
MKVNKWTVGLAAAGLITLAPAILAQTAPAPAAAPPQIPMLTTLSATTISGYVDTSAVWNPGTGNANPAPYAFNTANKHDGFNLDAVDVKIAKPQDTTGWSAGYVAELSYGPDAMAIDNGGGDGTYPIRQAYVVLHMPVGNGIDWQLGRWDNLLGYESSDSYKNPNFTRSYGYSFEPTEHTGLLGTYAVNSSISIQLGVADTVNTVGVNDRSDPGSPVIESKKSLISLLTLTAPDSWGAWKGSAFYVGFDLGEGNSDGPVITGAGPGGVATGSGHNRDELYLGATINTPVTGLTFGASWDWIHHFDGVVGGTGEFSGEPFDARYVDSVAVYGSYKLTDKLTLNGRAEYANGPGLTALAGTDLDKVFALTGTLQYDLWANVTSRLELRWDHAASGMAAFGGTVTTDGEGDEAITGLRKNEVMLAANVIYKF